MCGQILFKLVRPSIKLLRVLLFSSEFVELEKSYPAFGAQEELFSLHHAVPRGFIQVGNPEIFSAWHLGSSLFLGRLGKACKVSEPLVVHQLSQQLKTGAGFPRRDGSKEVVGKLGRPLGQNGVETECQSNCLEHKRM